MWWAGGEGYREHRCSLACTITTLVTREPGYDNSSVLEVITDLVSTAIIVFGGYSAKLLVVSAHKTHIPIESHPIPSQVCEDTPFPSKSYSHVIVSLSMILDSLRPFVLQASDERQCPTKTVGK